MATKKKATKKKAAKRARKSAIAKQVRGQAGRKAKGAPAPRGPFNVKGRRAKLAVGARPGGARKVRAGRTGGAVTRGLSVARRATRASGKAMGGG